MTPDYAPPNSPGTQPVSGFPAIQPVSGSASVGAYDLQGNLEIVDPQERALLDELVLLGRDAEMANDRFGSARLTDEGW